VCMYVCMCVCVRGGADLFRQLTLMETQMLIAVTPADMYYKTSKDGGKGGRRLMDLIDHFNRVGLEGTRLGRCLVHLL
jgi:hypothetical protein